MVLRIEDIVQILNPIASNLKDPNSAIFELGYDSRRIKDHPQVLFFAIETKNNDGHKYIPGLIEQGVKNFIITHPISDFSDYNANFIQVEDAILALQLIAANHRKQFSYPIIGITGSNGKTIVKEWLAHTLSSDYRVIKSPNSWNSQIGVPLSVWRMDTQYNLAIFEAGISQTGEMDALEAVIQPDIGIICNIGDAHMANFEGIYQKLLEKLRLFQRAKTLIYCSDHSMIHYALQKPEFQHLQLISWGMQEGTYRIEKVGKTETESIIKLQGYEQSVRIPFTDSASIENGMQVVTLLLHLGFPIEQINEKLALLSRLSMRMEVKEAINRSIVINDTYSLDLNSLAIALDFLNTQTQFEKRTLIISDFEQVLLGEEEYKHIFSMIQEHRINRVLWVGSKVIPYQHFMKNGTLTIFKDTRELLEYLRSGKIGQEAILVKGARKWQFEQVVQKLQLKSHQTVLQVDLAALVHNLHYYISKTAPNVQFMAMVKAFSYGLGDVELINELIYHHIDYLAVAYTDEGIILRKRKIKTPIVVLGAEAAGFHSMIQYQLEPEIFNFHYLEKWIETLKQYPEIKDYPIHIKIDTGMHRLGFDEEQIDELAELIAQNPQIKVRSLFSHLAAAEDPNEDRFTHQQAQLFQRICSKMEQKLGYSFLKHIANSAGITRFPEYHFDMVRLGIGLYGYTAVPEDQNHLNNTITLKSIITQVKKIKKGESIGYNRTFVADKDMILAVVPIGYADGYPRELSNRVGKMLVKGKECPVVGKVCMDMTLIDITGVDAKEEDDVIIYNSEMNLYRISKWIGKIPYELLTAISKRVQRIYIRD